MESRKDNTSLHFAMAFTIAAIALIVSTTIYNINDRTLMSKNIEQAITKGIDPLSVKCAYQTTIDPICITFSMKK
jgi:hypothetical protein